jgi:hypothetical protein
MTIATRRSTLVLETCDEKLDLLGTRVFIL